MKKNKMFLKLTLLTLAALFTFTNGAYIYSSFWAPIFNPKIINYRVDAKFDENGGKYARNEFESRYGYRGEKLIADLGNGKPPTDNVYKVSSFCLKTVDSS